MFGRCVMCSLWGSAMGVMSAIVAIPLGIGAMIWGIHDSEKYGLTVVLAGIYSMYVNLSFRFPICQTCVACAQIFILSMLFLAALT